MVKTPNRMKTWQTLASAVFFTIACSFASGLPAQAQGNDPTLTGVITPLGAYPIPPLNGALVTWSDTVENERGFLVYRVSGSMVTEVGCAINRPNVTSCSDTGIPQNTISKYYIYAYNNSGTLAAGNYLASRTNGRPSNSPTVLAATVRGPQTVKIDWTDNSLTETRYRLYRLVNGVWSLVGNAPSASGAGFLQNALVTDPSMDTSQLNIFIVASDGPAGVVFGDSYVYTLPAIASSGSLLPPSDVESYASSQPFTPLEVQVSISWIDNSPDEDGFLVYRSDGSGFTRVCVVPANARWCVSQQVNGPGAYETYFVYAYKGSTISTPVNVVRHIPDRFERPLIGGATGSSSSSILLTWPSDYEATGYKVFEYVNGTPVLLGSVGQSPTYFVATGLNPSTTHSYAIAKTNGARTSELSEAIYATTRAA
jgi:hypothetical protein